MGLLKLSNGASGEERSGNGEMENGQSPTCLRPRRTASTLATRTSSTCSGSEKGRLAELPFHYETSQSRCFYHFSQRRTSASGPAHPNLVAQTSQRESIFCRGWQVLPTLSRERSGKIRENTGKFVSALHPRRGKRTKSFAFASKSVNAHTCNDSIETFHSFFNDLKTCLRSLRSPLQSRLVSFSIPNFGQC
jgi:hypothetical protein